MKVDPLSKTVNFANEEGLTHTLPFARQDGGFYIPFVSLFDNEDRVEL